MSSWAMGRRLMAAHINRFCVDRFLVSAMLITLCACSRDEQHSATLQVAPESPATIARTIEMVDIPGGRFTMGTQREVGFQNGYPPHDVTVAPFRLGKYEVTFDQYDAFARMTGRPLPGDESWGRGNRPVIHVTWSEIHAFIDWLNTATGRRFRLPSEAEWEYAARGGTSTLYWWGDEADSNYANTVTDTGKDTWPVTAPVGQFPANGFGLHDVLGNVWEFSADCRHPNYEDAPSDGRARTDGDCDSRVVRGGFYGSIRRGMQVAARAAASEYFDSMGLGFRLAEDVTE